MKGKDRTKGLMIFKKLFSRNKKNDEKMRIKIENKKRVVLKKKILLKIKKRNQVFLLDWEKLWKMLKKLPKIEKLNEN